MTRHATPAEMYRIHVWRCRERFARYLGALPAPDDVAATFLDQLVRQVFLGAIEDLDAILAGQCPEDPARLAGMPIGQYHCPRCGCMLVAGMSGHPHDDGCLLGLNEVCTAGRAGRHVTRTGEL